MPYLEIVQFWVRIVVVENVLNTHKFEWQSNQENIVRRIAPLNDMKSMSKIDPTRKQELPKEGAAVFPEVPEGVTPLCRHGMSVNTNSVDDFVSLEVPLAPGT